MKGSMIRTGFFVLLFSALMGSPAVFAGDYDQPQPSGGAGGKSPLQTGGGTTQGNPGFGIPGAYQGSYPNAVPQKDQSASPKQQHQNSSLGTVNEPGTQSSPSSSGKGGDGY